MSPLTRLICGFMILGFTGTVTRTGGKAAGFTCLRDLGTCFTTSGTGGVDDFFLSVSAGGCCTGGTVSVAR